MKTSPEKIFAAISFLHYPLVDTYWSLCIAIDIIGHRLSLYVHAERSIPHSLTRATTYTCLHFYWNRNWRETTCTEKCFPCLGTNGKKKTHTQQQTMQQEEAASATYTNTMRLQRQRYCTTSNSNKQRFHFQPATQRNQQVEWNGKKNEFPSSSLCVRTGERDAAALM